MIRWFEGSLEALLVSPEGPVGRDMYRRGLKVESAAKGLCPNRTGFTPSGFPTKSTGRLRGSIHAMPPSTEDLLGGEFVAYVVIAASTGPVVKVGSPMPYAGFVEQGTYKMEAQPYLGPALESARE